MRQSATGDLPTEVLTDALRNAIADRPVVAAVFTTFTFDPGFFELNVLPALFTQPFSPTEKLRRVQQEDALRAVEAIAVYYDRTALSQNAEPAQLDYARIDVRRKTGVFHPKLVLVLVRDETDTDGDDEEYGEPSESLVVGVLSANLSRSGWWENIECGHFVEINDRDVNPERVPYRADLLDLIRQVRQTAAETDDHSALDRIHEFLRKRTTTDRLTNAMARGRYYTRLFCGQKQMTFPDWIASLRIQKHTWNLEVVSPYFDKGGADTLAALVDVIEPRAVRVYLPRSKEGEAAVDPATFDKINEVATWAYLPSDLVDRTTKEITADLLPRHVHAKVYRLWNKTDGELLIIGSVNLTRAAHSALRAGNLEAAILVDHTESGYPRRWWLTGEVERPESFPEDPPSEEDGCEISPVDITIRFDWATGRLWCRSDGPRDKPIDMLEVSGPKILTLAPSLRSAEVECEVDAAESMRAYLLTSSIVLLRRGRMTPWRVLVREENMVHKPSLLHQLTAEEILEFWSILSPEQRAEFLERCFGQVADLEGLEVISRERLENISTMFDRFAGIFHAFASLRSYTETAIKDGRTREAERRLCGAKYDSLPGLLDKEFERANVDPANAFVTFLCAKQVRRELARAHPAFFRSIRERLKPLDASLERTDELRSALVAAEGTVTTEFLDWYESMFLKQLGGAGSES